jgi:PPK2 family polyphosphate:nucleotide phosphotransferase
MMHKKYKIGHSDKIRLADLLTKDSHSFFSKGEEAKEWVAADVKKMENLQKILYADGRHSLLIIFQGMDTAGKDSCIRHLFSGLNPQGCNVTSFKQPTPQELSHDFIWRHNDSLPAKGSISIYNRSYYEDVLITRVHPRLLLNEKIPGITKAKEATESFWKLRFETINAFERQLVSSGTTILKFFLHISKEEQKKRLLDRIADKEKNWKFSADDIKERQYWEDYVKAYEAMLNHTSTQAAHWYAVPADEKWFSRAVIGRILVHTMEKMELQYPVMDKEHKVMLKAAEKELNAKD